jgi:hypothetical protein
MATQEEILGKMLAGGTSPGPAPMTPPPMMPPVVEQQDVALSQDLPDEDMMEEAPEKETNLPMDPLTLAEFQTKFGYDKDNRQYIDWSWFVYDNYVKGNHFVKFNDITQMVEAVPSTGSTRFAINKIWTTLRSVRGFVTKTDPKWYIYPEDNSEDSVQKAKYKQRVLDDRWLFGGLKEKTKQSVFQGLKYSIGIIELAWNSDDNEVEYIVLDPYDVYFGGPAYPYCTRVTKVVWRTHEDIENDDKYKKKLGDLDTTDTRFASTWKETLQNSVYGHQNRAGSDKGTLVYEVHEYVEKENKKGGHVNIATFTNSTFLRYVETTYDSLWDVFHFYRTDDNPGENYGEGWVKNLIPPQKLLDILESLTAEYHHTFAKGRYVMANNAGVKIVTNENGTMLLHNPGKRPIIENAPAMAASVDNQISRTNIYMEDIGGQHDASLGRLPTGASAGVAIEALQEGDANNLKDLAENFNIFLTKLAYGTFKMYARKLKTTKVIQTNDKDKNGKPDFFAIIGESATNIPETITYNGQEIPVCVIREEEKVRVSVDTWLAYTREAREQRVYKHYTAGLISRKAALNALNYNDVDEIIGDAIREEVVASMVSQGPAQPLPTDGGQAPPPETDTAGAITPGAGIPMPELG